VGPRAALGTVDRGKIIFLLPGIDPRSSRERAVKRSTQIVMQPTNTTVCSCFSVTVPVINLFYIIYIVV
jgi:hypothetical protein